MLTLPDVRPKRGGADGFTCGDVALRCVMRFHGLRKRERLVGLAEEIHGTDPATVQSWLLSARDAEPLATLTGTLTLDDLRHFTRTRRPPITLIQVDAGGGRTEGHYVVVRGATAARVHYFDPFAGMLSRPVADWLAGWYDTGRFGTAFRRWGLVAWPAA